MRIVFFLLFAVQVTSQTVIDIDIESDGFTPNTYYKDTNNILNKYVGTWVHNQNGVMLKIQFVKLNAVHNTEYNTYTDYLIGEYEYSVDGNIVVSTLSSLDDSSLAVEQHNIYGNLILFKTPANEIPDGPSSKIGLWFTDPERPYILAHSEALYTQNDPAEILFGIRASMIENAPPGAPDVLRIPYGDYLLIKQ